MGRRRPVRQEALWVATGELPRAGADPFYDRVNEILNDNDFDLFVEDRCRRFYAGKVGRPSLAPPIYFRLQLIGYFEGIDSERGIAWRLADSLALRHFADFALNEGTGPARARNNGKTSRRREKRSMAIDVGSRAIAASR